MSFRDTYDCGSLAPASLDFARFIQEKTPSFHVRQSPAYYYCFGCGAKGDAISFVQNMERISFPETVKLLAERYGIPLPKIESTPEADQTARERQALLEIHEKAAEIFKSQLTGNSEASRRSLI
jgi:DNA primase